MRAFLVLIVGWMVAGAASATVMCIDSGFGYDSCVINNGSFPPNPENFIDHGAYAEDQRVYVRNVGCPTNWGEAWVRADGSCLSPGDSTEVEITEGGLVSWLRVRDSSTATMSGGTVTWTVRAYDTSQVMLSGGWTAYVYAYDSSSVALDGDFATSEFQSHDSSKVTMSGGMVEGDLRSQGSSSLTLSGGDVLGSLSPSDSSTVAMNGGWVGQLFATGASTVTISGGTVWSQLTAYDSTAVTIRGGILAGFGAAYSSIITVEGRDFEVDGEPVLYGDLSAETGTLTGTLASGDFAQFYFYQGQGEGAFYTGTVTLVEYVPEPAVVGLYACALLALARLRMRLSIAVI